MTAHFAQRLAERGLDPRLAEVADWKAEQTTCDTAIRLMVLPKWVRAPDGSNGDEVWMIARRQRTITIMLRCSNQKKTPEAFGVTAVWPD